MFINLKNKILVLGIIMLFMLASCSMNSRHLLCGNFQSVEPMKNGKFFQLQINPDGSFIENNYYCTIYGRWHVGDEFVDCLFKMLGEKRLILRMDSIESNIQLHYDGDEENFSFRESVYFYYPSDSTIVELCDRMGERISISRISFKDGQNHTLYELDGDSAVTEAIKIPTGTSSFFWFQNRSPFTSGECFNYNSDSGSVCFVVLPHENDDNRIVYLGKNEIFYLPFYNYQTFPPLPKTIRQDSKIKLIRTDLSVEGD